MPREFNCKGCNAPDCNGCSEKPGYKEVKPEPLDGFDTPVTLVNVEPQRVTNYQQPISFTPEQVNLIKAKFAPNATQTEFELFMYMAKKYNLDPLIRQIWLVKFGDSPAQIYAGRDGYLEIAHRSGQFNGMKSWCEYTEDKNGKKIPLSGHSIVWRKDMEHPFETTVLFSEYSTGKGLWASDKKPSVMIIKVAESMGLRKAFSVSGIYSPEEMGD